MTTAHASACDKAKITKFRVHDWRHHWASHLVMGGADLLTLQRLGGWATAKMVGRYAALSAEHMADTMQIMK